MYRNLDAEKIVETVRRLRNRIQERFPEAGLGRQLHRVRFRTPQSASEQLTPNPAAKPAYIS